MKPEVDQILNAMAARMIQELSPGLATQYLQGVTRMAALMATLSAQEYDRAADIRVTENRDIRTLLAELAPVMADADLQARLAEAARGEDDSLRISALNQTNYALRNLLIEAHEAVEAQSDPASKRAETKIWSLLKRMADKRQLQIATS